MKINAVKKGVFNARFRFELVNGRALKQEGLFLGLSSGINLAGAMRLAREREPGQIIVTILIDSGFDDRSRRFNPTWLNARHLDPALPLESVLEAGQ